MARIVLFYSKPLVPIIFAAILNFCVKHKNAFFFELVRDTAILNEFYSLESVCKMMCQFFFSKYQSPAILGAHLEYVCKMQNIFLSEMVQDRVVWTNVFAQ